MIYKQLLWLCRGEKEIDYFLRYFTSESCWLYESCTSC